MTTPVFDNFATIATAATTSDTISLTLTVNGAQANRFLLAQCVFGTNHTISSITYAGVSLSLQARTSISSTYIQALYNMVAPATGVNALVIARPGVTSWSGTVIVSSWYNVHQTTPVGNTIATTSSAGAATATVSAATTDLIGYAMTAKSASGTAVGATEVYDIRTGAAGLHTEAGYFTPVGVTHTVAYSFAVNNLFIGHAFAIKDDGSAPPSAVRPVFLPLAGAGQG